MNVASSQSPRFIANQMTDVRFEPVLHAGKFLVEVPFVDKSHDLSILFHPRPTVRILFYTDQSSVLMPAQDFGATHLRDLIQNQTPFYAHFVVDIVNRHEGGNAHNKLTQSFLANYQQVWFFGILQCNQSGQPENELTTAEVNDLRAWMQTGGVLMTGDHANDNPEPGNGLPATLNLGRALGRNVPRARELRQWEGGPTTDPLNSHNTQVPEAGYDVNNLALQTDDNPQMLTLRRYALITAVIERWRPHPLFCGQHGPIQIFPDHAHEGELLIPATFGSDWPRATGGYQPTPEIVAWGTDKRNGQRYGVVTAYDGNSAGVGRIVADSTWHHYFNVNLRGLMGSHLDQIANYYINLAVWLSPASARTAMTQHLWWWLALQPSIFMVGLNPIAILGQTGLDVLGRIAGQCLVSEFIFHPPILERPFEILPPEELLLGGILQEYRLAIMAAEKGRVETRPAELIQRGIQKGVQTQIERSQTELRTFTILAEALQKRPS